MCRKNVVQECEREVSCGGPSSCHMTGQCLSDCPSSATCRWDLFLDDGVVALHPTFFFSERLLPGQCSLIVVPVSQFQTFRHACTEWCALRQRG